jgi:hypothetical protein
MAATVVLSKRNLALVESQCESMGLFLGRDFDFVWTENIDSGWALIFYNDHDAVMWQLKYGNVNN